MRLEAAALALPGVRHGFFGRPGGVSEGVFASLNVGLRSGDERARVLENRRRAAAALGSPLERLCIARQVHGTVCLAVEEPWPPERPPEADALVTTRPDLLLGVTSADCAPVLLADVEAGVVAAVHAGWRGALAGVLEAAVRGMLAAGADPGRTVAVVGPCIGRRSYEVGPEFRAAFLERDPESEPFFVEPGEGGRPRFDLEGYCCARLARAGIGRVQATGRDTAAEPSLFFSFRRTTLAGGGPFGLQLSAIGLAP
ncbi:MAG: peptidoglycan editing factor PgeF [Geminicoccaceae bacterium]|nr:peptidoglycan editing factor PgeF [Geminicoccaceae bacterium]MCX8100680.1 peptidoglycan editing factor PgeF [Geminicoccaceae bacterium]MDW8371008.1 peptidoglycan editing factor PgeF [Geminicoccaceae bacterium]